MSPSWTLSKEERTRIRGTAPCRVALLCRGVGRSRWGLLCRCPCRPMRFGVAEAGSIPVAPKTRVSNPRKGDACQLEIMPRPSRETLNFLGSRENCGQFLEFGLPVSVRWRAGTPTLSLWSAASKSRKGPKERCAQSKPAKRRRNCPRHGRSNYRSAPAPPVDASGS